MVLAAAPTLSGLVRLEAEVAPQPAIDMSADPACRTTRRGRSFVLDDDRLANVFVWIDGAPPAPEDAGVEHRLAMRSCTFEPRVLGARVGDRLVVHNDDRTLHAVHAEDFFHWVMPRGAPARSMVLPVTRIMVELEDEVHPWMHAYLAVLPHRRFAVTDGSGRFEIDLEGLPPGQWTLRFWHERLGPRSRRLEWEGEMMQLELTYTLGPLAH
jgi:hypothetical protein